MSDINVNRFVHLTKESHTIGGNESQPSWPPSPASTHNEARPNEPTSGFIDSTPCNSSLWGRKNPLWKSLAYSHYMKMRQWLPWTIPFFQREIRQVLGTAA